MEREYELFKINSFHTLNSLKDKIEYSQIGEILKKPLDLEYNMYKNLRFINKTSLYKFIDLDFDDTYEIIAFSDIHADLTRFVEFLINMNLIILEEDRYVWNPTANKKVIVICGDLIDGRRPYPGGANDNLNLTDNNELKLHILLYNLRLDCLKYDSHILCTMGNHDYFAFHVNPDDAPNYLYSQYIDKNTSISSIQLYFEYFLDTLKQYIEDVKNGKKLSTLDEQYIPHLQKLSDSINQILDEMHFYDALYIARNFLLSRFYSIGHHFFVKVNDSLFAHAGFYKEKKVFELFENSNRNFDYIPSPQLIHRKILGELSDIDTHIEYYCQALQEGESLTYGGLYKFITERVLRRLYQSFDEDKIKTLYPNLVLITEESLVNKFFQTRKLQTNCALVDQTLEKYQSNLLVVGHCPTCLKDYFSSRNTSGINNCNDARIVFSCGGKMATVDIAFSSAFSPKKKFYEYLSIKKVDGQKNIKVIRFDIENKMMFEYGYKKFNGTTWT